MQLPTPTNANVSLLVHACDRYEFLFTGFQHFFNKYWNPTINCEYYFATEEKWANIQGFKNVQSGKGEWSNRLKYLLTEKITSPYVLYFQEDMWLNKPVNPAFFNELFLLAVKNNWKQVKLHSSEVYCTQPGSIHIEGLNVARLDNKASGYLMSHQVSLWNKQFLIEQLHKNEHPWRNERRGTKRLKKLNPEILHIDYFAENGKPAINKNSNNSLRSEYQTISLNGMLNHNIIPFIEELKHDQKFTYAHELDFHYKNELTHDGKPRPKKENIFKKIKNTLK